MENQEITTMTIEVVSTGRLLLFAFAALLFHLVKSYLTALGRVGNESFGKAFIEWQWRKVLVSTILNIMAILILIGSRHSLMDMFPITCEFHAALIGYASQSILKGIFDKALKNNKNLNVNENKHSTVDKNNL